MRNKIYFAFLFLGCQLQIYSCETILANGHKNVVSSSEARIAYLRIIGDPPEGLMRTVCNITDSNGELLETFSAEFVLYREETHTWEADADLIDKTICVFDWDGDYVHSQSMWQTSAPFYRSTTWLMDYKGTRRVKQEDVDTDDYVIRWPGYYPGYLTILADPPTDEWMEVDCSIWSPGPYSMELDFFTESFNSSRNYTHVWEEYIEEIDRCECSFYWWNRNLGHHRMVWDLPAPYYKPTTWLMDSRGTRRIRQGNEDIEDKVTLWSDTIYTEFRFVMFNTNLFNIHCTAHDADVQTIQTLNYTYTRKSEGFLHHNWDSEEIETIFCQFSKAQCTSCSRKEFSYYIYGNGFPSLSSQFQLDFQRITRSMEENEPVSDFVTEWEVLKGYLYLEFDPPWGKMAASCDLRVKGMDKVIDSVRTEVERPFLYDKTWSTHPDTIDYVLCNFTWSGKVAQSYVWGRGVPSVGSKWLIDTRGIRRVLYDSEDFITLWEGEFETTTTEMSTTTTSTDSFTISTEEAGTTKDEFPTTTISTECTTGTRETTTVTTTPYSSTEIEESTPNTADSYFTHPRFIILVMSSVIICLWYVELLD